MGEILLLPCWFLCCYSIRSRYPSCKDSGGYSVGRRAASSMVRNRVEVMPFLLQPLLVLLLGQDPSPTQLMRD